MANSDIDILKLIWERDDNISGEVFRINNSSAVKVISCGEINAKGAFSGAEIIIDGVVYKGDIVFGDQPDRLVDQYTILQVTDSHSEPLLCRNGKRIPQLILNAPQEMKASLTSLMRGSNDCECGLWLSDINPALRISIFEDLFMERLERKCNDITDVFLKCDKDWTQTFHIMLFRAMGGNKNREAYMKLASLATSHMVMRERSSRTMVEALLLGTSGLLEGCYYDDYIRHLRMQFEYLCNKYRITPMHGGEWINSGINPRNNTFIRIVQLSSLLTSKDFFFDKILECRTIDNVRKIFCAEVSDYWKTHYIPDGSSKQCPKRIGESKADLFAINLVTPIMFAYGIHTGREDIKDAAIKLFEQIPAESNSIINKWSGKNVVIQNASDSQAIVQLTNEYCSKGRCTECKIGRRIIKKRVKDNIFQ